MNKDPNNYIGQKEKKIFPCREYDFFEWIFVIIVVLTISSLILISRNATFSAKAYALEENVFYQKRLQASQDSLLFARPTPPLKYAEDPKAKALFYATHFWDQFDFDRGDSYLAYSQKLEDVFVDFLSVVLSLDPDKKNRLITLPLERSQGELYRFFEAKYAAYLYDPSSPLMDEEAYLVVTTWLMNSPKTDFATHERVKFISRLLRNNRVGSKAIDFRITLDNGCTKNLSDYRGNPTLLIFYTPGCGECRKLSELIEKDTQLRQVVKDRMVHLLYVFPENDSKKFTESLDELPSFAEKGYDSEGKIMQDLIYDLRHSPDIYYLQSDGTVLEKDTTLEKIKEKISVSAHNRTLR